MDRAVFFGDSFVAAAARFRPGYARVTPLLLRWRGSLMARGGTGFVKVADDGRKPYPDRLAELLAVKADIVVVQASGNDATCDLAEVAEAADSFLCRVQAAFSRVYVLGPMWTIAEPENLPELSGALAKVCGELDIPFIDGLSWLNPQLIGPDGEHPTWRGHALIAWRLANAIRSLGVS